MDDYRQSHLASGEHYDSTLASSPFDYYMTVLETQFAQAAIRRRFPQGVPRYLDFACGTGRLTSMLAPLARRTVGVDVSESMLAQARAKCPDVDFYCQDLTQSTTSAPLGQFDLVSAFRFFGNAQQELRRAVLRALNGCLLTGGLLLLNNHRNPHAFIPWVHGLLGAPHGMDLHHGRLYALLRESGFSVLERRPIGAWIPRASVMNRVNPAGRLERAMERLFAGGMLARLAPDSLILAQKVSEPRSP